MLSREQESQERPKERFTFAPVTHTLIPPTEQRGTPLPVWPWLYSAVLGNGNLLLCLDETGSIAQLFYPYIDAGPHVRSFLSGIQVSHPSVTTTETGDQMNSEHNVSWLADKEWSHQLSYLEGIAPLVRCISINSALEVQIEQTMVVHSEHDVYINDIQITNMGNTPVECKFIQYAGFDFDYRRSGNTCYVNREQGSLLFFALNRYISITCSAPIYKYGCDKSSLDRVDRVFQEASTGIFNGREYAVGQVNGAISYDFGRIEPHTAVVQRMCLCFARTLDEVTALSLSSSIMTSDSNEIVAWWNRHYADARLPGGSPQVRRVYDRSLMVLRLMTDRKTGGIIAAPEVDPDFRSSGGYGYCWPRDGAFIGHALDTIGQYEHARSFYDWALRVQAASGVWYQRYYVSGELAPVWGLVQFDETGAVVWAICRHIQLTGDDDYGRSVFSQLVRACEYMYAERDPETGLAPVTKDLWEERDGISTYACASTWAGFHELSQVATRLGEVGEAQRWATAADELKTAIETHLWDDSRQRFLRGLNTKIDRDKRERLSRQPGFDETTLQKIETTGRTRYLQRYDDAIDTSILGLSIPFGVFSASDPRIIATTDAIVQSLTVSGGSIRRYEDDTYRNGNPWVICTLWLALQYLETEQNELALDLYSWVVEHRTSLDLLPEQVDPATGEPCWVVPLAWSHAMFILVTHVLVERGLLP